MQVALVPQMMKQKGPVLGTIGLAMALIGWLAVPWLATRPYRMPYAEVQLEGMVALIALVCFLTAVVLGSFAAFPRTPSRRISTSGAKLSSRLVDNAWWLAITTGLAGLFFVMMAHSGVHGTSGPKNACINNLRWIDEAKEALALERKLTNGALVTEDQVRACLKDGVIPRCPQGGKYSINPIGEDPTCSIPEHKLPPP